MQTFRFLDFPGEIRDQVYRHLLLPPRPCGFQPIQSEFKVCVSILRVNRQIYQEAEPVLYGLNLFKLSPHYKPTLNVCLSAMSSAGVPWNYISPRISDRRLFPKLARFHTTIALDWPCNSPNSVSANCWPGPTLLSFPNIKELCIMVYPQYGANEYGEKGGFLKTFECLRGLKKVQIQGELGPYEEYARWLRATMMSPPGTIIEPFYGSEEEEEVDTASDDDEDDGGAFSTIAVTFSSN